MNYASNILSRSAFELLSLLLFKDQNTTILWFAMQKELNTSLTEKLIDVQQQIIKLDQKVIGTGEELSSHGKVKFISFYNYSVLPSLNKRYYYMEESVLLGTKPRVDSIRHFIRDPSGVFFVCHLCERRIVQ